MQPTLRTPAALLLLTAAAVLASLHTGVGDDGPWRYKAFLAFACECAGLAILLLLRPRRASMGMQTVRQYTVWQVYRAVFAVALVTQFCCCQDALSLGAYAGFAIGLAVAVLCSMILPASLPQVLPMALRREDVGGIAVVVLLSEGLWLMQDGLAPVRTGRTSEMSLLVAVVIAPIVEEMLFRGVVWEACRRFLPVSLTILLTACLFTLAHRWAMTGGPTTAHVFAIAGFGVLAGMLRAWTGSVVPGILAHALANGLPFALALLL